MTKYYNLTKMLASMMFRKDSPIISDDAIKPDSEPGIVLARMRQLVEERNINAAENLLFDMLDKQKPVYAAIALELYARLSMLEEKELEAADFSVEEIGQGITDMMKVYNIRLVAKNDPNAPKTAANAAPIGMMAPGVKGMAMRPPMSVPKQAPVAPNVLADKPTGKK